MEDNTRLFPKSVKLDEAGIRRLIKAFQDAQHEIFSAMLTAADPAPDRRLRVLAAIDRELEALGIDTQNWLDTIVPQAYADGASQALAQIEALGGLIAIDETFTAIDREAVAALIGDMRDRFGDSFTTTARSARKTLSDVSKVQIRDTLVRGRIEGQSKREIVQTVRGIIYDQGVTGLVDKRGRKWSLERYANTLVQTKLTEARNSGLSNRMLQNGYDLVKVSKHDMDDESDPCYKWQGKILSLTGRTKGYKTVDDATRSGLFHPNCRHAVNAYIPVPGVVQYDPVTNAYA